MDTKLNVPITTLTNTISLRAKRETTPAGKAYLFEIVEGLGNAIATQHPGGLKVEEFVQACGVSPSWATQAA
jgi:hypothetical protein